MFFSHRFRAQSAAIALLCLLAVLFMGCNAEPEDNGNLNGTWSDGWGTVTINTSAKTIKYENSYEGKIANSPDYAAANGVLIIEFTKYWDVTWVEVNGDWLPEAEETDKYNGKFGAMYWANLTDDSVILSDAGTGGFDDYEHTMFDTLEEAKTSFTLDKAGDYAFLSGTPYTKQK